MWHDVKTGKRKDGLIFLQGTQNFSISELDEMQNFPGEAAMRTGRRPLYHMKYLWEGKPCIKPQNTKKELKSKEAV